MSFDEATLPALKKVPTGIKGFDEIPYGGLPAGRPTLVAGSAGSGKTLFGLEFLVSGATQYNENGVFMCFEETEDDLAVNVSSLGFNLRQLVKDGKLAIDFVSIQSSEIEETGEYDLGHRRKWAEGDCKPLDFDGYVCKDNAITRLPDTCIRILSGSKPAVSHAVQLSESSSTL